MERFDITIRMYRADASGTQYVWEKVPAEEGDFVLYADAQATIAALQARVKELEESRDAWKASQECSEKAYMSLVNQIPAERFDYDPVNVALLDGAKEQEIIGRKQIADLQDLLKRTDENREQWRKLCQEAQSQLTQRTAELEAAQRKARLQREVEAALSSKVTEYEVELNGDPQNFYGRGRTVGLRTLIAALPKVEGAVVVSHGYVKDSTRCHALFGADEDAALYAALLQHRQGMEG